MVGSPRKSPFFQDNRSRAFPKTLQRTPNTKWRLDKELENPGLEVQSNPGSTEGSRLDSNSNAGPILLSKQIQAVEELMGSSREKISIAPSPADSVKPLLATEVTGLVDIETDKECINDNGLVGVTCEKLVVGRAASTSMILCDCSSKPQSVSDMVADEVVTLVNSREGINEGTQERENCVSPVVSRVLPDPQAQSSRPPVEAQVAFPKESQSSFVGPVFGPGPSGHADRSSSRGWGSVLSLQSPRVGFKSSNKDRDYFPFQRNRKVARATHLGIYENGHQKICGKRKEVSATNDPEGVATKVRKVEGVEDSIRQSSRERDSSGLVTGVLVSPTEEDDGLSADRCLSVRRSQ
ncbi:hypothetical protein LWI29_004515 [Acer saccharum]|uniref:Uncharacterized protein n=1 Tax=Acer saccharum TaxID=4024 RepID=A0AA39RGY2_ACESA|nr:hypothetical protein LWI29_004515 [Acer saccharum]